MMQIHDWCFMMNIHDVKIRDWISHDADSWFKIHCADTCINYDFTILSVAKSLGNNQFAASADERNALPLYGRLERLRLRLRLRVIGV